MIDWQQEDRNKKRILVLTEASYNKGFGHFYRTSTICEMAFRRGISASMIIDGDDVARNSIDKEYTSFIDWQDDIDKIGNIIGGSTIVVVDSYNVDLDTLEKICDINGNTIIIDDNSRLNYSNMMIMNPNYYAEHFEYPSDNNNRYFLGRDYILLREAFQFTPSRIIRQDVKDVMITMGGTDANQETVNVACALKSIDPGVSLHVIITSAYTSEKEILSLLTGNDHLYKDINDKEMSTLMQNVDFAVSAGGGTSNELIKMQCPAILYVAADNQKDNANIMKDEGCFNILERDHILEISNMFGEAERKRLFEGMKKYESGNSGQAFICDMANTSS